MRSDDNPMPDATLVIEDLHVAVEDKEILRGVDLTVEPGRVHALMGPNGSGKSTLAYALAGHPRYRVTGGKVTFKGEDVLDLLPDERARLGMFLAMQYPVEVPGVSVTNFLRTAINAVRGEEVSVRDFARELREQMRQLDMDPKFAERSLNEGFSGGEKKRHEILQMALLRPQLAILDETDSGLDVDALRVVADGVNRLRSPELGILLITHYTRILRYISPDFVHVMVDGRVVQSGGPELADELEAKGYERWRGDPAA
jgi:Fe-S cluster assembly ATP-binding protein